MMTCDVMKMLLYAVYGGVSGNRNARVHSDATVASKFARFKSG